MTFSEIVSMCRVIIRLRHFILEQITLTSNKSTTTITRKYISSLIPSQQERYPVQAFMDVYFFSAIQEYAKTQAEKDQIFLKTKKIS